MLLLPWEKRLAHLLATEFSKRKKKEPKLTYRAFAKIAGISAGSLSDLLANKGHWRVPKSRAVTMLHKLGFQEDVINSLKVEMGLEPSFEVVELPEEKYSILQDWIYYAVLFSLDLPLPLSEPANVAQRFGLNLSQIEKALEKLAEQNLIEKTKNGRYRRLSNVLKTSEDIPNKLLEEAHINTLHLAEKALRALPAERRSFSSFTFVGDETRLKRFTEQIRKLHLSAAPFMDGGDKNDQVFRLCVQLFPIDFSE